jgi:hypothetical protein
MGELRVIDSEIRSVKNTSGASLPEGKIIIVNAAPTVEDEVMVASAATDAFYGVVKDAAIADGEWGVAQIRGRAKVLAGGAVAVGARVTSDANGDGVTAVAGNGVLGIAATVGVDDALFEVELAGPGGCTMPT